MTIIISNNKSAAKSRPASVQLVTDRSFQAKPVPKFKVVPWERTLVRLKVHDHMITCTQIHKYTNTQIHKYTNTQIHIHGKAHCCLASLVPTIAPATVTVLHTLFNIHMSLISLPVRRASVDRCWPAASQAAHHSTLIICRNGRPRDAHGTHFTR